MRRDIVLPGRRDQDLLRRDRTSVETKDTPENRYVKAFLGDLRDASHDLYSRLRLARKHAVATQVLDWEMRISEWLEAPLWRDVQRMTHFPSNSQVLQKSAQYREILATDLRMQMGMHAPWSGEPSEDEHVQGDLRPISHLYEYWCFFFLRGILRELCGSESRGESTLVRASNGGLAISLRRGRESRLRYTYGDPTHGSHAKLHLFYNKKFERTPAGQTDWEGSYSASLNPDFSIRIEVVEGDRSHVHWMHFDAKYRLDIRQWQAAIASDALDEVEADLEVAAEDQMQRRTYKRADLYKMHTYRDALLGSRGSYVLFPGDNESEEIFIRYPGVEYAADGPVIPGVGAFQATPANSTLQSSTVGRFLTRCLQHLVGASGYREELGIEP